MIWKICHLHNQKSYDARIVSIGAKEDCAKCGITTLATRIFTAVVRKGEPMNRLIDADALQKEYMYEHDGKRLMLIDVAPTIEERKTGEWIDGYKRQTCSVCKQRGYQSWSFCPNCGSYNGGESDDIPIEYFENGGIKKENGMRLIDADELMATLSHNCYPVQHDMTSIEPGMTLMGMLQAIQEQPTIEPQRWIPCSERLPEDEQNVLVTYKTTDKIHPCQYHDDGSRNPWYSYIDQCRAHMNVVLAWMPLPEPYQEEGEKDGKDT